VTRHRGELVAYASVDCVRLGEVTSRSWLLISSGSKRAVCSRRPVPPRNPFSALLGFPLHSQPPARSRAPKRKDARKLQNLATHLTPSLLFPSHHGRLLLRTTIRRRSTTTACVGRRNTYCRRCQRRWSNRRTEIGSAESSWAR
jgi:hypothetical protein